MPRKAISTDIQRRIIAESMGRCMNPLCNAILFLDGGDIIERAYIVPYCETADNSYENLIILCPTCHEKFDKCHEFTKEEVLEWKNKRKNEIEEKFAHKFNTFEELSKKIKPLLLRNKTIFESYYLNENKNLWDKFETEVLVNNNYIKQILNSNLDLFQRDKIDEYSNLYYIEKLILHIDEFQKTRIEKEKIRQELFPKEINSIFGIEPETEQVLPMTESLECLITSLINENRFIKLGIGIEKPYIEIIFDDKKECIYLGDIPRLRQLYYDNNCFRQVKVRFKSLNFALKFIRDRGIGFIFPDKKILRKIIINGKEMLFVYEYCLSKAALMNYSSNIGSIIVNLHNWNGDSCISNEAYELANELGIKLLDMKGFYKYIRELKNSKSN